MPRPSSSTASEASQVLAGLKRLYPGAHCELDFKSPFQLLCATILSAQCTDKAVNAVTPALFKKFPDAPRLARAREAEVQALIKSIGLYRNKARNLVACARMLVEKHQGKVPESMEALVELPGVGRKTANVVRYNAFGLPGLAVDTHVLRVGRRLGWFKSQNPVQVEAELCAMLPPRLWGLCSHWLIWHGRRTCSARTPACESCGIAKLCPSRGRPDRFE